MKNKIPQLFQWISRIISGVWLLFAFYFIFSHIFGSEVTSRELTSNEIGAMTFGLLNLVGLIIGYWRSWTGGWIALVSAIGFFSLRIDLLSSAIISLCLILPSLLLILSAKLNR